MAKDKRIDFKIIMKNKDGSKLEKQNSESAKYENGDIAISYDPKDGFNVKAKHNNSIEEVIIKSDQPGFENNVFKKTGGEYKLYNPALDKGPSAAPDLAVAKGPVPKNPATTAPVAAANRLPQQFTHPNLKNDEYIVSFFENGYFRSGQENWLRLNKKDKFDNKVCSIKFDNDNKFAISVEDEGFNGTIVVTNPDKNTPNTRYFTYIISNGQLVQSDDSPQIPEILKTSSLQRYETGQSSQVVEEKFKSYSDRPGSITITYNDGAEERTFYRNRANEIDLKEFAVSYNAKTGKYQITPFKDVNGKPFTGKIIINHLNKEDVKNSGVQAIKFDVTNGRIDSAVIDQEEIDRENEEAEKKRKAAQQLPVAPTNPNQPSTTPVICSIFTYHDNKGNKQTIDLRSQPNKTFKNNLLTAEFKDDKCHFTCEIDFTGVIYQTDARGNKVQEFKIVNGKFAGRHIFDGKESMVSPVVINGESYGPVLISSGFTVETTVTNPAVNTTTTATPPPPHAPVNEQAMLKARDTLPVVVGRPPVKSALPAASMAGANPIPHGKGEKIVPPKNPVIEGRHVDRLKDKPIAPSRAP